MNPLIKFMAHSLKKLSIVASGQGTFSKAIYNNSELCCILHNLSCMLDSTQDSELNKDLILEARARLVELTGNSATAKIIKKFVDSYFPGDDFNSDDENCDIEYYNEKLLVTFATDIKDCHRLAQQQYHKDIIAVLSSLGMNEPEQTYNEYNLIFAKTFLHREANKIQKKWDSIKQASPNETEIKVVEEETDKFTNTYFPNFESKLPVAEQLPLNGGPECSPTALDHTNPAPATSDNAESNGIYRSNTHQTIETISEIDDTGGHSELSIESTEAHFLFADSPARLITSDLYNVHEIDKNEKYIAFMKLYGGIDGQINENIDHILNELSTEPDNKIDIAIAAICAMHAFKKVDDDHFSGYIPLILDPSINPTIATLLTALGVGDNSGDENKESTAYIAKQFSAFFRTKRSTNPEAGFTLTKTLSQLSEEIRHVENIAPTEVTSNLQAHHFAGLSFLVQRDYLSLENAKNFAKLASNEVGKSRDIWSLGILLLSLTGKNIDPNMLDTLQRDNAINTSETDEKKRIISQIDIALEACGITDKNVRNTHALRFANLVSSQDDGHSAGQFNSQKIVLSMFTWIEALTHPKTQTMLLIGIFLTVYCMAHVSLNLLGIQFTAMKVASLIGVNVAILGIGMMFMSNLLNSISLKVYEHRELPTPSDNIAAVRHVSKIGIWSSLTSWLAPQDNATNNESNTTTTSHEA